MPEPENFSESRTCFSRIHKYKGKLFWLSSKDAPVEIGNLETVSHCIYLDAKHLYRLHINPVNNLKLFPFVIKFSPAITRRNPVLKPIRRRVGFVRQFSLCQRKNDNVQLMGPQHRKFQKVEMCVFGIPRRSVTLIRACLYLNDSVVVNFGHSSKIPTSSVTVESR